ncbi:TetR/AcrR family transcriptional regulator [Actinospica durhamensis]|uniref:TetR/AcrR family transcriptional regulator n=1 Tax=Actinospica durhamensis TaxID=1508375 RepID=A0A941EY04_9ACTN|nr:TetR/AcrR family transcriptional regulator [Actinospica durhamensis]MBR7837084.1 TetR/AcrR family transcriptional regulator [Actinospica durhamensis]
MAVEPPTPGAKPRQTRAPRADAQRNRDRLVEVARAAFAAQDSVTLEGIAKDAGVGIGTLYRHFPTREDLVEAVYAAELDEVTAAAPDLLRELAPDEALRAWLGRYAAFVATKRGMLETLRASWASGRLAIPTTRERITAAVAAILARGAETGTLRADVEPDDVVAMLLGIFFTRVAEGTDADEKHGHDGQTARLLDLVVDAARPRAQ